MDRYAPLHLDCTSLAREREREREREEMASRPEGSLRWRLLRQYLLPRRDEAAEEDDELAKISRRPRGRFGVISAETVATCDGDSSIGQGNTLIRYSLHTGSHKELVLLQRSGDDLGLTDLALIKENLDMTGIVGLWPAEEVLTYFCISNASFFRSKRILELGSGYGLAGLAVAACTDAAEVVITDGNPQVIEYVEHNIRKNSETFGETRVQACNLCWGQEQSFSVGQFDIVIAADCTFFEPSHADLAHTVKCLLKRSIEARALLFNPKRNRSLSLFLQATQKLSLHVELLEQYNDTIWQIHQSLLRADNSMWKNYDPEHCYPILAVITHAHLGQCCNIKSFTELLLEP